LERRRIQEIAKRVSFLFNPLVIGVPLVVLIGIKDQGGIRTDVILPAVLCVGIMCVFPLLYTVALLRLGVIEDFHISDRRQRIYLFPVLLLCFLTVVYILRRTDGVSPLVQALIATGLVNCLICAVISIRFKISLHCAGLGGLLVGLYYAFGLGVFCMGLAGLAMTAWSRIVLKEHAVSEVVAGSIFGLAATAGEFLLFYGTP
jgi:hypothetical protein